MPGSGIWAIIAGDTVGTVMYEGCRKVNVMNRGVIDGDCCPDFVGGSCDPSQAAIVANNISHPYSAVYNMLQNNSTGIRTRMSTRTKPQKYLRESN